MLAQVKTAASKSLEQNMARSAQEMRFTDSVINANQNLSSNDSNR